MQKHPKEEHQSTTPNPKEQLERELYKCLVHELGHWVFDHLIQETYEKIALLVYFKLSPGGTPVHISGKISMPMHHIPWSKDIQKKKMAYASGYAAQRLLGIKLSLDKGTQGDLKIYEGKEEFNQWVKQVTPILSDFRKQIKQGAQEIARSLSSKQGGWYEFNDEKVKELLGVKFEEKKKSHPEFL